MSNCSTHMPKMIDSVLEALSRYIAGSTIGVDRNNYGLDLGGIASGYAGNMFGEVIRDSNMGETIADKLCKFIH
jgi:thiamine biosynthesis lipoprotein ApbE